MTTNFNSSTTRKRRILLIANTCWYLRNFRSELTRALEQEGYEVVLSAGVDADVNDAFFQSHEFYALKLSRKGKNPLAEIAGIIHLFRLCKRVRPDVVLTWTPKPNLYGGIVCRLQKIPFIPNVSGLGALFVNENWISRVIGSLYKFAFGKAETVFFQNEDDKSSFENAGWVKRNKARRLPGSGVDINRFAYKPLPPLTPFVFLYVGRFVADKGLLHLVEAAETLRADGCSFILRLVGFVDEGNPSGITQDQLDDWARRGLVEHVGRLRDVRPALEAAHCVVLPSYYREGVPRSLLEAAAIGRPIITTDHSGCRDTVRDGENGYLCEPRDSMSLAHNMRRALQASLPELERMSVESRKLAEIEFTESYVFDAYINALRQA